MSTPSLTLDEICRLEVWAKSNAECGPEYSQALKAFSSLRDLMSLSMSQKNLLKYLHQQMGITPKSERGSNSLAKQSGESVIPRGILRQP
jgi:hypothetical protein